ncbi:MAG: GNAT family N-acetyltransferase [Defluviitaleaceae bacterium]|nr:GNAT family N-acetyltransferase [Defluviitaleaceae bacterium]
MKVYKTLENGIKIVEYEECYAAGLAEMWNRSAEFWGGGSDLATEQAQIDFFRTGSYYNVYVALDGNEVAGLCSLARYYKDADALYIHVLNVRPDYQSKKLGKALVLLCVERTMEVGFPRLELHTWPGNVKAVPLYKKCGFMWEDNSETTHLSNFIPTVLAQDLLKPFFAKADWYADSARSLEIIPDGMFDADFEFFTYKWAKEGEWLEVTFEKSGRRICRVETDDYTVELGAENHQLAYGFDYKAKLIVKNKSGKPLGVKIRSINDGVIEWDFECADTVKDEAEYISAFRVNKPAHKQDPFRKHPCLLANVTVNGLELEMGAGIEAKAPLTAAFDAECGLAIPGKRFDAFITVKSALLSAAGIQFTLPQNDYIRFDYSDKTVETCALGKASVKLTAEVLKTGHVTLGIPCAITLENGQAAQFTMPTDIISKGLSGRFAYDNEDAYGLVNGLFELYTLKDSNRTEVKYLLGNESMTQIEFLPCKLGKPYDDEFNLAVPIDVKTYETGADIAMELSYRSEKQAGIMMTMIYTLSAGGVVTRVNRLENEGNAPKAVFLSEIVCAGVDHNAVYRYGGRTVMSSDAGDQGIAAADPGLFEENWLFENDPALPVGTCWSPELKPVFKWNDVVELEHKFGDIQPGKVFETPPVICSIGGFRDYMSFRDFARGVYSARTEPAEDLLELNVNGRNPFICGDEFTAALLNNRNMSYEGKVEIVPAHDGFFEPCVQINPKDERVAENNFTVRPDKTRLNGGIGVVNARMSFPSYLSERRQAVFFPGGGIKTIKNDGVLSVSNGLLTFKSDPNHYAGLFSLQDSYGTEWLMSKYPKLEPYSWWNPFVGGMYVVFNKMNCMAALKEKMSAEFTAVTDCFGNNWQGIKTRVDVVNHKEYKGLVYEQFYLTLPGVPVLCAFTRFANSTGGYLKLEAYEVFFPAFGSGFGEREAEIKHKGKQRRFMLGGNDFRTNDVQFIKLSAENSKLHYVPNLADRRTWCYSGNSINSSEFTRDISLRLENGGELLTAPMFHILTDKDLSAPELAALERITF